MLDSKGIRNFSFVQGCTWKHFQYSDVLFYDYNNVKVIFLLYKYAVIKYKFVK